MSPEPWDLGDPETFKALVEKLGALVLIPAAGLAEADQAVAHWRAAGVPDMLIGVVLTDAVLRKGHAMSVAFALVDRVS